MAESILWLLLREAKAFVANNFKLLTQFPQDFSCHEFILGNVNYPSG